jgi:DNA-binding NtrC family response regulator
VVSREDLPTSREPSDGGGVRLVVAGEKLHATHILPEQGAFSIGRSKATDVSIDDLSVSRRHALLKLGRESTIEDLVSSLGTHVNGVRLRPGVPSLVRPGDVLRLGDVVLVLLAERDERFGPASEDDAPIVQNPAMVALYDTATSIAEGRINVLLLGETGTGKDVLARFIHARSPRAAERFVALNCATFGAGLLESELFGYEKGAFTDAKTAKPGLLEHAHGGTVFLDEVGEMPLPVQSKLLRVIEEREVQRLGSLSTREIDVRFVAATNADLELEGAAGRFRKDLLFRLNGVTLRVPPLRERVAEIEPLVRRFARGFSADLGWAEPVIERAALDALERHAWPGNVRELRNAVERALLLARGAPIGPSHLPLELVGGAKALPETSAAREPDETTTQTLTAETRRGVIALESQRIAEALERCAGNQTRAAELLGISRRSLVRKLARYGIDRPRKGVAEP